MDDFLSLGAGMGLDKVDDRTGWRYRKNPMKLVGAVRRNIEVMKRVETITERWSEDVVRHSVRMFGVVLSKVYRNSNEESIPQFSRKTAETLPNGTSCHSQIAESEQMRPKGETDFRSVSNMMIDVGVETSCGKHYEAMEFVCRCQDCQINSSAVMCFPCFLSSPCRHHRHYYHVSFGGGMCDCGDPHSWKEESFCARHRRGAAEEDCLAHVSADAREWIPEVVRGHVQYIALRLLIELVLAEEAILSGRENAVPFPEDAVPLVENLYDLSVNGGSAGRHLLAQAWKEPLRSEYDPPLPTEWCKRLGLDGNIHSALEVLFLVYALRKRTFEKSSEKKNNTANAAASSQDEEGSNDDDDDEFDDLEDDGDDEGDDLDFDDLDDDGDDEGDNLDFDDLDDDGDDEGDNVDDVDEEGGNDSFALTRDTQVAEQTTPGNKNGAQMGWRKLSRILDELMSDHDFRLTYAALGLRYVYHAPNGESFDNVQVLANCAVIEYLLDYRNMLPTSQISPAHGGGSEPFTDTIVHRYLAQLFYILSYPVTRGPTTRSSAESKERDKDALEVNCGTNGLPTISLDVTSNLRKRSSMYSFSHFSSIVTGSMLASVTPVTSLLALRELNAILHTITLGARIAATLESSANSCHKPREMMVVVPYIREALRHITQQVYLNMARRDQTATMERYIADNSTWLVPLQKSRRLDPISCPVVQTEEFKLLGKAVAVQDSEEPLIGFKRRRAATASGSGGDGGAVVVAGDFQCCGGAEYLMDVLGEMWRSMVHTYKTLWEHLIGPAAMRKVALRERVTSREPGVVYRHDISGNGERHPLLPHNMAECFFADVLAAGVLRSADEEDEVANDEEYPKPFWRLSFREWDDAAVVSSTSLTAGRRPCIPFLDTCQREELDWLLDSVAMKFVWATQVDGQLWRGKVSQTDVSAVLLHADQYVFLLQLLTGVYSPDDFAYRLLERHTFRGEKEGSALCGFQGFLWLIGSLLLTPLTRSLRAEDGVDRLKALTANFLSIAPRPRSQVHSFVEQYHLQYGVVAKEDEMMNLVDGVLASVTVSDADGRISRLKDLETWELVQPYHHTLRDLDLEKVHQTYSGLVHSHNAAAVDDAKKSGKPAPPPREPRVPPVEFGCDIDASADPAWRTCARDLLHTTAVLRVCVLQVLLHAEWVAKRGAAGSKGGKRAADAAHSTEKGFLHALHLLYLSARDAALIARTMANRRRRELGEKLVTQDLDDRAAIDWPLVEDFLARHVWNTCRYDDESVSRLLPVLVWRAGADVGGDAAATLAPCSLAELMRCSVQVSPSVCGAASGPRVLCSVLEDLLLYYRNNASDDHFSYAVMLEHVLCVTSCLGQDRLLRRAAGSEEETRKQKMKERQAELLRKFRSKKGGAAKAGGGDAAEAAAPEVVATSAEASVPDVGFLDVLVYQMCDRQCCICGVAGEDEPLKLLVNTTTSNVLTQVGYTLAAQRCSHNHMSTCGHVAHTRCVERFRLLLRQQMLLDDAGISLMCPLCRTPFTSLSPMPEMRRHGSDDGEEGAATEAMADGVRLVRGWRDGFARDAPLLSVLQSMIRSGGADAVAFAGPDFGACVAMASIGEVAGSTASLPPADALLRERNSAAWELAERMRTVQYQLQLEVEHVKVGGRVAEKTLFGLLSLLLSFNADAVREHEAALREHFARLPSSDFLLLLLDILSLRSPSPRSASALIGDYTARMLRCSPAVDRCVSTLVAECGEAGPITAELVALWGSLGCLTLLQLLVSEERCSDDVATVRWVFAPKDASVGERVSLASLQIVTLEESLLNHADAGPLSEAVLRMMRYLLPVAPAAVEASSDWVVAHKAALRTHVADLSRGAHDEESLLLVPVLIPRAAVPPSVTDPETSSMCFSSKAWQQYVAEHILHLPREYIDLIASLYRDCPNRAKGPKLPVQCRRCLQWVDGVESEKLKIQDDVLYEHVKQCEGSGGAGLFLFLHYNALIVVNAVQKHCGYVHSPYVTQFGESRTSVVRSVLVCSEDKLGAACRGWVQNHYVQV